MRLTRLIKSINAEHARRCRSHSPSGAMCAPRVLRRPRTVARPWPAGVRFGRKADKHEISRAVSSAPPRRSTGSTRVRRHARLQVAVRLGAVRTSHSERDRAWPYSARKNPTCRRVRFVLTQPGERNSIAARGRDRPTESRRDAARSPCRRERGSAPLATRRPGPFFKGRHFMARYVDPRFTAQLSSRC